MPIYEYVCQDCRTAFEKTVFNRSESIAYPSCGSQRYTLQLSVIATPTKRGNGESATSGCGCTPSACGCH